MEHLTINGKLRTFISINELKNVLYQKINYEPTITIIDKRNFKCYISIGTNDKYTIIDIILIFIKHCSNFKIEVDEEDYHESIFSSPYFNFSTYYTWDGKNLKRCFKDYFGSTCEYVDYNTLKGCLY